MLLTVRAPALTGVVAAGGMLMAHDWHDRTLWFSRGWRRYVPDREQRLQVVLGEDLEGDHRVRALDPRHAARAGP